MRRIVMAAALAATTLAGGSGHAAPEELYVVSVFAAAHWSSDGLGLSSGVRLSATALGASIPVGGDLEASYRFDRSRFRIIPSMHVYPADAITAQNCPPLAVRRRSEQLSVGPVVGLSAGPVLELGAGDPSFGFAAGAMGGAALFGGRLRALWITSHGPELELGAGLRMPSILGWDDAGVLCQLPSGG